jgi:hypothetical protein
MLDDIKSKMAAKASDWSIMRKQYAAHEKQPSRINTKINKPTLVYEGST